jgi:hypothetical protein
MDCLRRRACALAPTALILGLDALLRSSRPARPIRAPLDLLAHAATAAILLAPCRPPDRPPWRLAALGGAMLLDLDHLPQACGSWWLAARGERPYPHSLIFAAALVTLGNRLAGARRDLAVGTAAGIATHLVRDMATGGVLLLWPLHRRSIRIPYWGYAALLILGTGARLSAPSRER